jgi:two-component system phosphate regulon sensor histidine kinase PhoR
MIGTSIEHPQFNNSLWDFIRRIIHQPGDIFTDAIDVSHPKNPNKILSFQANAAKMWEESQGGYLGTVIALRDVTALQEIDRMKANFMTGITHELKTPLAIITLQLGGLMKYYDRLEETKKLEMIQKVDNATRLLSRLVDSILELSRLDSGMLKFNFTPTNLVELSRQVIQELLPLAEQKSLNLTFHSPEHVVMIDADPHQLDRVVRSLTENAIKYTPQGSIAVTVTKNEHQGIVDISDTGIGLTEEHMERLFERFYRADTQRNILGTGLGLSITQEIVRHHQGEVKVSSVYGQGSTFKVFIPLKK